MKQVDLGAEALWSLVLVSILAGIAMMYVFRRWSDQDQIGSTANRMLAHLMEFRLFIDEPALVIRAQRDLLLENWHLLRLLVRPSVILILPSIVLLAQMDGCYGRAPLRIGDPAVITVQLKHGAGAALRGIALKTPALVRVETPGVRIESVNQVCWRIRPIGPLSGHLQVVGPEHVITKSIVSGYGVHYLSERRSLPEFFLHMSEPPLVDSSIASIEVPYPSVTILHLHWLVWFLLISSGTAIITQGLPDMINRILARV
jgi:hypothetical protein